jgi:hypothetical protein
MDKTVSRIVDEIKADFDDGFQILDVITVTANIVKLIQLDRSLRSQGELKKKIALVVFRQLVDESVLSDEDATRIAEFMLNDLPNLIDTFKSLSTSIAREWNRRKLCCFGPQV